MRRGIATIVTLALATGLVLGTVAGPAGAMGSFTTRLSGEAEVPGPGDPNGAGRATIETFPFKHRVCFDLKWSRIRSPFAAHIHVGRADEAGPVKVTLFATDQPLPASIGRVAGCVGGVNTALLQRIEEHPRAFYVNVHNRQYPDGAIRGQVKG